MKISFKRITSSGNFIPEIDGLRFIAIAAVVLYHLNGFIVAKYVHSHTTGVNLSFIHNIFSHGFLGVPMFFAISGFILGLPFAKYYLAQGNSINIKNYFLRRLTRLEPPYIIAMTLLLLGAIYIAKTVTVSEGISSYLASIFYVHNIIYPDILPKLNAVTWSLEVEIQFYILAPLMAFIFKIKNTKLRRSVMILLIVLFSSINKFQFNPIHAITLVDYFSYFLIGYLLADVYVFPSTISHKTKFDSFFGLLSFIAIWLFIDADFVSNTAKFCWELVQLAAIFIFFYYVLVHRIFKLLSVRLITNIGGMCYSIYLLHFPIISIFGNPLLQHSFSSYPLINIGIYSIILISIVLFVSGIFFLTIERPCMRKNWYKAIFLRK